MTVVTIPGDVGQPFTVSDLAEMPDDGRRYELIDGALLVQAWTAIRPFPARVVPAELARGLRP